MADIVSIAEAGHYEIRPTRRQSRSVGAAAMWTVFVGLSVAASHGQERVLKISGAVIGGLVTLSLLHVWRRLAVLSLSSDTLIYTGLFTRRVVARLPLSGRAVTAEVAWPSGRRSQRWLLLDDEGRTRLGLDLTAWNAGELNALSDWVGLHRELDATPRSPVELRRRYPGAYPWALAHGYLSTILLIVAATTVYVVVWALVHSVR